MCKLCASLKLFEPLNAASHVRYEMVTNGFQTTKNEDKRFQYFCTHASVFNSFMEIFNSFLESLLLPKFCRLVKFPLVLRISESAVVN